jgi:HPt (histidine-containing phosphotransfer) domain-containing protein
MAWRRTAASGGREVVQSDQMIAAEPNDNPPEPGGVPRSPGDESAPFSIPDPVVFDRAQLLARAMGDSELVRVVVDGFLDDFPRQIDRFGRDLEQGRTEALAKGLHNMKGVASTVAAVQLRHWVSRMEEAAKGGDLGALESALPGLKECFERLATEMRR